MQQRGFTLIELIIVIVILGILAVTAAPRFLDLSDDANEAAVAGVQGSVDSAANIIRAAWLAGGSTGTTVTNDGDTITVENDQVAKQADGYPAATAAGIGSSVDISASWSQGLGAAGYIFVAVSTFPTDATQDGAICVVYSLSGTDRAQTSTGTFAWVTGDASTCT